MITESGAELSARQFFKRVKRILKEDPAMDGSEHLYLRPDQPAPLPEPVVISIQAHTIEALHAQGIEGFDEGKTRSFISVVLHYIALPRRGAREPGTPRLNKKKKSKTKNKAWKAQKPQKQAQQKPQKHKRKDEVRVVQVTVKKARTFHYSRDLPAGES